MAGQKLRRCSICKRFHAAYLVPELGRDNGHLCYECWLAWQSDAAMRARLTSRANDAPPDAKDTHSH